MLSFYSLPFDLRDVDSEACRQYGACMQWACNTAAAYFQLISFKASVGSIKIDTRNCKSFYHYEPGEHYTALIYALFPNSAPRTQWNNVDHGVLHSWTERQHPLLFLQLLMIFILVIHWIRLHNGTHHNLVPLLCLCVKSVNNIKESLFVMFEIQ